MTSVTCAYCGLPFKVRRAAPGRVVYCSTGCAVASRVPVDAKGDFPVNAALISALAIGFVYFNQLLFWGLATLLAGEGRTDAAATCVLVSWCAGAVMWLVLAVALMRSVPTRAADLLLLGTSLALVVTGWRVGSLACAAGANGLLLAWSVRGLLKQKTRRNPDVTV